MRIEVLIDELVLDGFEPGERHAIADAVERELAGRLASARGPWGGAADGLADTLVVQAPAWRGGYGHAARTPDAMGAGIGRSVADALIGLGSEAATSTPVRSGAPMGRRGHDAAEGRS